MPLSPESEVSPVAVDAPHARRSHLALGGWLGALVMFALALSLDARGSVGGRGQIHAVELFLAGLGPAVFLGRRGGALLSRRQTLATSQRVARVFVPVAAMGCAVLAAVGEPWIAIGLLVPAMLALAVLERETRPGRVRAVDAEPLVLRPRRSPGWCGAGLGLANAWFIGLAAGVMWDAELGTLIIVFGSVPGLVFGVGIGWMAGTTLAWSHPTRQLVIAAVALASVCLLALAFGMMPLVPYAAIPTVVGCLWLVAWTRPVDVLEVPTAQIWGQSTTTTTNDPP